MNNKDKKNVDPYFGYTLEELQEEPTIDYMPVPETMSRAAEDRISKIEKLMKDNTYPYGLLLMAIQQIKEVVEMYKCYGFEEDEAMDGILHPLTGMFEPIKFGERERMAVELLNMTLETM